MGRLTNQLIDLMRVQRKRFLKNLSRSVKKILWFFRSRRIQKKLATIPGLPSYPQDADLTFVFAPEAALPSSSAGMVMIARALQDQGHEVLFSQCFKSFAVCPVMLSKRCLVNGDDQSHSKLCPSCVDSSLERSKASGLNALDIRSLRTEPMDQKIRHAIERAPDNLLDFKFDSIPFGKICTVDLVLATKVSNLEQATGSIRAAWLRLIEASLQSYLLMHELLQNLPVKRIFYFNNYSLNLGVSLACRSLDIPVYGVTFAYHRNVDFRRYVIFSSAVALHAREMLSAWPELSRMALSVSRVQEIADDIVIRFGGGGSHVYSAAKSHEGFDAYEKFGLDSKRKLIVAYTSSLDELIACKAVLEGQGINLEQCPQPFLDQIDWLKELTEYVSRSMHLQLVVRVHPREGINHRDKVKSEHLKKLQSTFDAKIPHCHFIWPGDPTSSYDLAEFADVALTSWSSMGVELARLAIPVLAAFNYAEVAYPYGNFLHWAESKAEYFSLLQDLLYLSPSTETIQQAYRWYNLFNLSLSIDLSDVVPASDCMEYPQYKLPRNAKFIEDAIVGGESVLRRNLATLKREQNDDSEIEEQMALQHQCRRFIHFFCTGEDNQDAANRMRLIACSEQKESELKLNNQCDNHGIYASGPRISYFYNNQKFERFSPLVSRLIAIAFAAAPQATTHVNPFSIQSEHEFNQRNRRTA